MRFDRIKEDILKEIKHLPIISAKVLLEEIASWCDDMAESLKSDDEDDDG